MSNPAVGAPQAVAAGELPGFAVEDFRYPNADGVLQEKGIVLKRGDGHVTLADCGSASGLLQIMRRPEDAVPVCFKVTGDSGFLTLEIPSVYGVKGNDYDTTVDMTVGSEKKSFTVTPNQWTPVGETTDPTGREFMLVEIRMQK
ncbi:hypothetical protein DEJ51_00460 [Streptomyces venezuelae]|uniref:Secreted protein n=1 Tax=Streptomyces venezuelae TaxID=54571 RepID=A0A5P2DU22_STRVZ|nr:hypothetical protein DEJ51_00460 [Streptomyces venezuelae]